MILQTILIPKKKRESYIRGGRIKEGKLFLLKGESLSFDTYFNSFSYPKYRDYTKADAVEFEVEFCGEVVASWCVFDGEERILCKKRGKSERKTSLIFSANFKDLPQNGILYLKIEAKKESEILGGSYCAKCEFEPIKCSVVICTYRRESFVLKNIERFQKGKFTWISHVYVIDNGNTLETQTDSFIQVIPNKNVGGSGGFTRGLLEAEQEEATHVILMDDDIVFHPETMEQMTIFLSILKKEWKESWFSAAMITLDQPEKQYEMGAIWDGKKSIGKKRGLDLGKRENLLMNMKNREIQYGGWWTMLFPLSVLKRVGFPLPFFIKFDDVEYGMRKPLGTEIITMNGIAVYHEAFDRKVNFALDYYNLRNELIVNVLYKNLSLIGALKRVWYEVCKEIFLYRYDCCLLVFQAVKDFLRGVDFFLETDGEKENQKLINLVPKLIPLEEIPEWEESLRCDKHKRSYKVTLPMILTMGGQILPSVFLKKEKYGVPLSKASAVDLFGRKWAIQYQLGKEVGILTKHSTKKFVKYGLGAIGLSFQLIKKYGKVKIEFQERKEEISSMIFWKKYLGINSNNE